MDHGISTKLAFSKSTITGKEYQLPLQADDQVGIDAFLATHAGKKVVVVQGLGFVGAVMSLVVANALTEEYAVIGVDLPTRFSYWKIASINEGNFPIISSDEKIKHYYETARAKQNVYATFDSYAYSRADVIIVDINLDVSKISDAERNLEEYDVDMTPFAKAIEQIANHCRQDVLILVESTVPPGTCELLVKPTIEKGLTARELQLNYKLGHSYERVMPGPGYIDSIQNFYRVYSGIDPESADAVETFLRSIIHTDVYPLTRLNNTTATEMGKVLENSFRAMNIAFIQEWTEFAEHAKVNLYDVIQAIRMRPTHKNIMLPGLGVGGYCLTKDPLLASWASQHFFNHRPLSQSEKAVMINDKMPLHAYNNIKGIVSELSGRNILLLGVSYLNDVGDTRYTPMELLYEKLVAEGAHISLHDPYVSYWEEKGLAVLTDFKDVLHQHYDIVIFCTAHKIYKNSEAIRKHFQSAKSCLILDTVGVITQTFIEEFRANHQIKIIGRGDI